MDELEKLKYPVGEYIPKRQYSNEDIKKGTETIRLLAGKLKKAITGLNEKQLDTRYRDGGWTIRQVVHHIADSHINAYVRFRLALTEETPVINPYNQDKWAELNDANTLPVEVSINLIEALHNRWANLIESLNDKDLNKNYFHPEQHNTVNLDYVVDIYAWHCEHHLAQIENLKKKMKW